MIISTEKEKDAVTIKTVEEFINFYYKEKAYNKNITFKGDYKITGKMDAVKEFLNYYLTIKEKCEQQTNIYNDLFIREDNKFIKQAMEIFTDMNSGGKYIRAFLTALGYQIFKKDSKYLPLSSALEIFQTSILIHDDIIDNAEKRRKADVIPIRYKKIYNDPILKNESYEKKLENVSNSMAMCLGDLGFYLTNQIIVKNYSNNPNLPKLLEYFNDIVIKTCKGEMIDVILPFYEEFYKESEDLENQIMEIYKLKTSWYSIVGPFILGTILAGIDKEKIEILEDALINLGIAYQIKDDILGIYGNEEKIGKSTSSDIEEYKQTILYYYAINTKYKEELLKYYGKKINEKDIKKVREILDKSKAKEYSTNIMNKLFQESIENILNIDFIETKYKKILLGFIEYLKVRSK